MAVSNDNDWKDFAKESSVITVIDDISIALSKFQNFKLVSLTEEEIKDLIKNKRPLHETAPLLEAYHQTEKKQRMAMK